MKNRLLVISIFALWSLLATHFSWADALSPKTLTVFYGQSNVNDLLDIVQLRIGKFEPYSILGVQYSQKFLDVPTYFNLEWAGHLVKHFERWDLFEVDALVILRWNWFPWNSYLNTSLGMGEGFSLASGHPSSETVSQGIYAPFLNYLWIDLRFSIPALPEWGADIILHHRSGIYGLIAGVEGGSNYISFGVTRRL